MTALHWLAISMIWFLRSSCSGFMAWMRQSPVRRRPKSILDSLSVSWFWLSWVVASSLIPNWTSFRLARFPLASCFCYCYLTTDFDMLELSGWSSSYSSLIFLRELWPCISSSSSSSESTGFSRFFLAFSMLFCTSSMVNPSILSWKRLSSKSLQE